MLRNTLRQLGLEARFLGQGIINGLQEAPLHHVEGLQQHPPHVGLSVLGAELAQQELRGQPLGHEVGHPVAIVAVEDPVQEAVVLTPELEPVVLRWVALGALAISRIAAVGG